MTPIVSVTDEVSLGENDREADTDWKPEADADTDEVDDADA